MIPCNGNYHQPEIGRILEFIKNFKESQENDFQKALEEYMKKYFNSVFSEITYDSETETIILQMATEQAGEDGVHSYRNSALVIM